MKTKITIALLAFAFVWVAQANADEYEIVSETTRVVTAYNVGDPNQCDDDPCIAARNFNICAALDKGEKHCALNAVPWGTVIEIEGYGRCTVTDRTNSRYRNRVDVAFKKDQYKEALTWGKQILNVKILRKKGM